MIALAEVKPASLTRRILTAIQLSLNKLCSEDPNSRKAINIGTNGKGAIANRISRAKAAVASITGSN